MPAVKLTISYRGKRLTGRDIPASDRAYCFREGVRLYGATVADIRPGDLIVTAHDVPDEERRKLRFLQLTMDAGFACNLVPVLAVEHVEVAQCQP